MIGADRLTKHERNVLIGALAQYRARQERNETRMAGPADRSRAKANGYVASDLLRQVNEQ